LVFALKVTADSETGESFQPLSVAPAVERSVTWYRAPGVPAILN
jgi:hypothetical protein